MIFLCFSGRDRHTIVRSVLYHLENYGLNVWYDNHKYILGDHKVKNYTEAINSSEYTVVILSKYFFDSLGAVEELDVIQQQYLERKLHIFPILYEIYASEVPSGFQWLLDLIYNELNRETGSLLTCNQIICKILHDEITINSYPDFRRITDYGEIAKQDQIYIKQLINDYNTMVQSNIAGRLTILYSIATFIQSRIELGTHHSKTLRYLFSTTKLNITYDFKEIEIMEYVTTITLNMFIRSHYQ